MRLQIITIGKKHDQNLVRYIEEFEKRIRGDFDLTWSIISSLDDNNKEVQIKKESVKILDILNKEKYSFIILLDENGKQKSTIELSDIFKEKMNNGIDKIIFIIGGAYGVSEELKEKANLILSLSRLVFPHQLVRTILIEQIYRAISILKNGKYHHE